MKKIVSRFSPSNSGILHLGNSRTAIVSYILAKQAKGEFILRIEDTDITRSTPEWTKNILDSLNWFGISSDRPVEYQMENHANHKYEQVAQNLISQGLAYYCNCSTDTLKRMKATQIIHKARLGYDGRCSTENNKSGTLRLNIEKVAEIFTGRRIPINDVVLGDRHEDYRNLPDPVLLRSDGTPTYLMANTVDDALSGVNLITRGSDLYSQTAIQVLLYKAIIGTSATYAHLPLMYNEFGNKLSKRSPDTKGILQYKAEGFLPDAIIQFALSLGNMSIPTDRAMTFDEMIATYDISKTNNRATSFVEHKIRHLNRLHIRATDDSVLAKVLLDDYGLTVNPTILSVFKQRCDTMVELADLLQFTISAVKEHFDELKELARDNFSGASCKHFRDTALGGRKTPPIDELYKLVS